MSLRALISGRNTLRAAPFLIVDRGPAVTINAPVPPPKPPTIGNLSQTYDGTGKSVTVSGTGPFVITYNGSSTVPTAVGSYNIVAYTKGYQNYAYATLVISPVAVTLTVTNTSATYDGTAKKVTVTSTPKVQLLVTYNGDEAAPVDAGTYSVSVQTLDPNYTGSAAATLTVSKASATMTLTNQSVTYDGKAHDIVLTTTPAGLKYSLLYVDAGGSILPGSPVDAGTYTVTAALIDKNATASTATGTVTIAKAAATLTLSNLAVKASGSQKPVTVLSVPSGLATSVTYTPSGGSATSTPPSNAGSYAVAATVTDPNYTGTATGTLVISALSGTIALENLTAVYDGKPHAATVVTNPVGQSSSVTYTDTVGNHSTTPPTAAGSYSVSASIVNSSYSGTATGTLVISAASARVQITTTSASYSGSPATASVQTVPTGLATTLQWFDASGSTLDSAPVKVGNYSVQATVSDSNGSGVSAITPFTILSTPSGLALSNLVQTYDGTPKMPTVNASVAGITYQVIYGGQYTQPPVEPGSYTVAAIPTDPNYVSAARGVLVIAPIAASVTLSGLSVTYDTTQKGVGYTTSPAGLPVSLTYTDAAGNSTSTPPTAAGSYQVSAVIFDPHYSGAATGTLVIAQKAAPVTLSGLSATYDGTSKTATVTTSPASLSTSVTYTPQGGVAGTIAPLSVGSYAVTATITDPNYTGSATGTLTVSKASATITLSGLTPTYDGTAKLPVVTTSPSGIPTSLTFTDATGTQTTTPPTAVGSYLVGASLVSANYAAQAALGTLVIGKATASVVLGGLNQSSDGSPREVVVTTTPPGLNVGITYAGGTLAPSATGSYAVTATVNDPSYQGSASGTLVVGPSSAFVTREVVLSLNASTGRALLASILRPVAIAAIDLQANDIQTLRLRFVRQTSTGGYLSQRLDPGNGITIVAKAAQGLGNLGTLFQVTGFSEGQDKLGWYYEATLSTTSQPILDGLAVRPVLQGIVSCVVNNSDGSLHATISFPCNIHESAYAPGNTLPPEATDLKATQADAEAGTSNTLWMTPVRTFQAIAKWVITNLGLNLAGAAQGQVATFNGTQWVPADPTGGSGGGSFDQSLNTTDAVRFDINGNSPNQESTGGASMTWGLEGAGRGMPDGTMTFANGAAAIGSNGGSAVLLGGAVQIVNMPVTGGGSGGGATTIPVLVINGGSLTSDGTTLYLNGTAVGGGADQLLNTTDIVGFTGLIIGAEVGNYVHSGNHRAQIIATGTQTPLMIQGGSGAIELWKTTSARDGVVSFGRAVPGNAVTGDFVFASYSGSWSETCRIRTGGGFVVPRLASAPTSPIAGEQYYNTATGHFMGYTGAGWKQLDN